MQPRISSFDPVINEESKILILGSVPGVKSLEKQEYYAHPQNTFWKIIFELFQESFTEKYSKKIEILNKNKIALWDVIDTCERKGSLDSEIRNEEANDIETLLKNHPNISAIFCNGGKSFKNLKKILKDKSNISVYLLPSTSPLHTISFDKKLAAWEVIKTHI